MKLPITRCWSDNPVITSALSCIKGTVDTSMLKWQQCQIQNDLPVLTSFCLSQGKIACANVLSDLYAMGITECDNMLMLLSVSQKMNDKVSVCTVGCQGVNFTYIYCCHICVSSTN